MNKITPNIWLGDFFGANDRDKLHANVSAALEQKITHILSVCDFKPPHANEFIHKHIRLDDVPTSNLFKHFNDIYEFMNEAIENGGIVFVHCMAGISRSSTSVICYLMKKHQWTASQALARVKSKRSIVCPNLGFQQQLLEWEKQLKKDNPSFGIDESSQVEQSKGCGPRPTHYFACKVCKSQLFTNNELIHQPPDRPASKSGKTPRSAPQCDAYFTSHLPWLPQATEDTNIRCPRHTCEFKLGYYCKEGAECGCGKSMVASFQFLKTKQVVDFTPESTGLKSLRISSEKRKTPTASPLPPSVVSKYYLHQRGKSLSHHLENQPKKNSLHLANFVGMRSQKPSKAQKEDRAVSLYTAGRKIMK